MSVITSETAFALPYRYRLLINMWSLIGWLFGRDERLTALLTLLRAEMVEAAEGDEAYDAFVDVVADALRMRSHHA
ncbi:hypothetical protein [Bradyrhizobium japonicum]|uniref:hypothetical protein n=1 Tax=Bradyrhizobium japonicum TaxID=375 RepID=UPI00200DED15|nr:hypothetical protein [Bradyrhizobium japonicum]UQD96063.1 hypothetical protein JEY30_31470 [Bradyrhizobium japonicum]